MAAPLIVVGVDGSEGSRLALEWALEEARLRDAEILAVYAWMLAPVSVPDMPRTLDWKALQDSAQEFLDDFVGAVAHRHEAVVVEQTVANGAPAEVLVGAARDAEMLVVGSRGLGGFRNLLLGSVSNQCVQHASCPVVVVHGPRAGSKKAGAERAAVMA